MSPKPTSGPEQRPVPRDPGTICAVKTAVTGKPRACGNPDFAVHRSGADLTISGRVDRPIGVIAARHSFGTVGRQETEYLGEIWGQTFPCFVHG